MIIDEAHLFLPSNERTLATDVLIDWIKLGRHPGLSLILATQEPSALHESAIRQSDIMIAHNVTSSDDVAALGKAKQSFMTGSQDIQKIVSTMEFKKGLAVMFDDKTRKIEMCRVRPRLTIHSGVDASAVPPEELHRHGP
jgi:DNA helicase HerA-like ATPase